MLRASGRRTARCASAPRRSAPRRAGTVDASRAGEAVAARPDGQGDGLHADPVGRLCPARSHRRSDRPRRVAFQVAACRPDRTFTYQAVNEPGRLPDATAGQRVRRVQPDGASLRYLARHHTGRGSGPDCRRKRVSDCALSRTTQAGSILKVPECPKGSVRGNSRPETASSARPAKSLRSSALSTRSDRSLHTSGLEFEADARIGWYDIACAFFSHQ